MAHVPFSGLAETFVVYLPAETKELLGVSSGVKVSLIPFEAG